MKGIIQRILAWPLVIIMMLSLSSGCILRIPHVKKQTQVKELIELGEKTAAHI